ncbi:M56 family metallopeptidase [uncultured Olleya sp.]|uniref:M56 family metallopeptidase n=1 Tax=uncultured Olleya sp. TaxID=757243 RepID=UPI0025924CBD|nr:M56 family metallopeptidase [uncultured Olleya sp.]
MEYILKASAIIILFYTCYKLFLQRETFFQANRWFLLIGLFTAIVLPLIVIPIYIEYTPTPIQYHQTTNNTTITQPIIQETTFDYWTLLPIVYLLGALFVTIKITLQFWSLHKLLKHQKTVKQGAFKHVQIKRQIAPFSFFKTIVYNPYQFSKQELKHIITHEKIHATQNHTIDNIIAQIATILFWFNPCIWWYKKALQQNLEFIADHEAQNKTECAKSYQTLLLKASLDTNQLAITNNFYQSLIKKRIVMLQKSKSKKSNLLKLTIILPFLALFLMSFNTKEVYIANAETSKTQQKTPDEILILTSKSSDLNIERIKNKLEANSEGLKIKFSNLKRNADGEIINLSIETKLKGKSKYNHNATYGNDLEIPISNIHLKIENGELVFGDQKQNLVMRVTERGVVADKFPLKEKTSSTVKVYSHNTGDNIKLKTDNEKALLIVDGKKTNAKDINLIDPNSIVNISVLKDKNAIDAYGEEGKNGVIIIKTSTNTENNSQDVNYGISSTTYSDDEDSSKNFTKLEITKNTPDTVLDQHKKHISSLGQTLEYITLRRNRKKEITKLKMLITNTSGQNNKVLYQSSKGIPNITINIDAEGVISID